MENLEGFYLEGALLDRAMRIATLFFPKEDPMNQQLAQLISRELRQLEIEVTYRMHEKHSGTGAG